ncbi:uncharacterized protein TRIADDRAFT_60388 [Trichoplax adhaerens]|uniref:Uncharacterized protein n=1 Tax=Trichoplax adhaerens TaxID=10228 RepID=B3S832_TRIAD|nr:predicted protein [Trichoplax adhaerens]EDV21124.1 predicted protein [Trichoplax adhaerens]|eukprot:XP_002116454.1 predicted protein [Trichoplax adhaerens]
MRTCVTAQTIPTPKLHSERSDSFRCLKMKSVLALIAIFAILPLPSSQYERLTSIIAGFLNNNVCEVESDGQRLNSIIKNLSIKNQKDPQCCEGWSRPNGIIYGEDPCFTPVCRQSCGKGEFCILPETCLCVGIYSDCFFNSQFFKSQDNTDLLIESKKDHKLVGLPRSNHTCPVDIPQFVSAACLADRQTELAQSQTIYALRQTPDFNNPLRDPTVLIPPLWDADPGTAFGVAFSDPLENPWFFSYQFTLQDSANLAATFLTTGNNSLRDFTVIEDYKALFSFFYDAQLVKQLVTISDVRH